MEKEMQGGKQTEKAAGTGRRREDKEETGRQIYQMKYSSPIGLLTLTADTEALISLEFEQERYPFTLPAGCRLTVFSEYSENAPESLRQAARWLDSYFSGRKPEFLPPLRPEGSPFRLRVWKELLKIPYGTTVTYGSIAKKLAEEDGRPHMSAQAVGGAVGHNPIGIMIPCHRVVGADGSLTGFGGGIETKKALLTLEGRKA